MFSSAHWANHRSGKLLCNHRQVWTIEKHVIRATAHVCRLVSYAFKCSRSAPSHPLTLGIPSVLHVSVLRSRAKRWTCFAKESQPCQQPDHLLHGLDCAFCKPVYVANDRVTNHPSMPNLSTMTTTSTEYSEPSANPFAREDSSSTVPFPQESSKPHT